MSDLAKLSGSPDFPRRPLFHALNQKAIAKRYADVASGQYTAEWIRVPGLSYEGEVRASGSKCVCP